MPEKTARHVGVNLPILQPGKKNTNGNRSRSGRGRTRAFVLICVHLIILAHIAHFLISGRSLSPVEPSESMYTIELGQLNAGAILFGVVILGTAIFGRFFCGWGCHLVALQDLSGYLLRRLGIRPKPLRSRLLALVPFALAFYMFLWPTVNRLWQGDPHPGFTNHLITGNFWYSFPGPVVSVLTLAVCGGLIVYLLGNKGFCTYACPYGAFFVVSDRLAIGRIRVTDACQHCGQCTAHCTSNVQVHAEVQQFGMVVDPGCMKCMDCVSVCPNDALYFGLTTKAGSQPSINDSPKADRLSRKKKVYDFSLPEEFLGSIVAIVTVYALRGLYDITPLLLSVAIGVITGYLTIKLVRVFRKRDQRLQNIQLKRSGRTTTSGQILGVLLCGWFAFIAHSCFVQYHRYRGRDHLRLISATWDELLSGSAQQRLTTEDQANISTALRSFQITDRMGLVDVMEVKLGLAVGHLLNEDRESAEKFLRQAYYCDAFTIREMLQEFLVIQGRPEDAAEIR